MQPPVSTSRHWVGWNTAQKPLFFAANINSVNECLQVWRISLRTYFGLKCSPVCRVFVAINSVSHLPDSVAQFAFSCALDGDMRQRDRHTGQNEQDRRGG